jgi:predicted  nucleic acid-binding Zn-ribbon protein
MTMTFARDITVDEHRCYTCGRYWLVDRTASITACPVCAGETTKKLREELAASERTINALRGAITKLKNKAHTR